MISKLASNNKKEILLFLIEFVLFLIFDVVQKVYAVIVVEMLIAFIVWYVGTCWA